MEKNTTCGRIIHRKASEIEVKAINWLWLTRFAKGKLSIIAGEPGLGKSQVTISMAAHITTGTAWPDGTACEIGHVIFLSAEDDASDTIVPRLMAAGADLSRVHIIDVVKQQIINGGEVLNQFSLATDLQALEKMINEIGNVAAIFIDPVSAYMGANIDDHKNTAVRSILTPLTKFAEKLGVAIISITHLNKNEAQKVLNRVIGSIGYIAAARVAFAVIRDKANKDRRLFLPLKNNIGNDETGLAFTIQEDRINDNIITSKISWATEIITQKADELMNTQQGGDKSAHEDAEEFLQSILEGGPVAVKEILQLIEDEGISEKTLRRAKKELGIEAKREGFGSGSKSFWRLPLKNDEKSIHGQDAHTRP